MAGDDKAYLKTLERYDSPAAVAKALRELRTKVDSGELKAPLKPLADGATPEQVATWRKENGLPENAGAFINALKLADGLMPGKEDQPLLSSFAELATNKGWNQETFNSAVDFYYQLQDKASADRDAADGDFFQETMAELSGEWGKEFKANQAAIGSLMNMFPAEIRDQMLLARTPDGRLLGDHPLFNKAALMLAKDLNPAATILPAAASGGLQAVESRIAEIETKHMRAQQGSPAWDAYWRGDGGAKMQQEYRDLLSARERMAQRSSAA